MCFHCVHAKRSHGFYYFKRLYQIVLLLPANYYQLVASQYQYEAPVNTKYHEFTNIKTIYYIMIRFILLVRTTFINACDVSFKNRCSLWQLSQGFCVNEFGLCVDPRRGDCIAGSKWDYNCHDNETTTTSTSTATSTRSTSSRSVSQH